MLVDGSDFLSVPRYKKEMLNATVVDRLDVTSDLIIIRIKPDSGVPDFHPGQYVAIGLPGSWPRYEGAEPEIEAPVADKIIKRAYSIGSSPREKQYLEFYIAVVPNGALTARLATVKVGDRVFAQPKVTGTFTAESVPVEHNLVLVATGTGLAPYMSMIRTPEIWTVSRRITIVHGVRFPQDFAYSDELLSFAKERENFTYLPISSRAPESWEGRKGRIQRLFEDGILQLNPAVDHVFLCGNPAMIDDVERDLTGKGYSVHSKKSPGNLHLEKYW